MPFGLCSSGGTFQRLMNVALSRRHFHVCLVYVDDVILFLVLAEKYLERLIIVFGRLCLAGLKLKPERCALFQKSVSFLGHVVSENGISTDPSKTKAMVEWPVPRNLCEVCAFFRLAGYYRRFVPLVY